MDVSNIEDRVILGLPVETQFGSLKALSIKDYIQRINSLSVITLGKKNLLAELGKQQKQETGQTDNEIWSLLKELNKNSLKTLLNEYFNDLLIHYIILTRYCVFFYLEKEVDEDGILETDEEFDTRCLTESMNFINNLSDEDFDFYRTLLLTLHGQTEPKAHLNPKLQRFEDMKNQIKPSGDTPNLPTMISSCAVYMGLTYEEITKWNSLQLQHSFQRIALFLQNSATTLYGTVTSEVELVNWAENITVEKEKEKTLDQYSNKMGKALK